ncbi:hypothetical protein BDN70DRAFT_884917 [Pholiota conissans]|uniref:Uncharacterized protein n=1 Tax=Pholiota conissans TaxID=109636 RepID=A0A9P5YSF7_9AGAR|nr:hypothetical protein BDN70DRAFT_884917 [Pholiota conissans]
MSFSKHAASAVRASKKPIGARGFRSPFAVLGSSPLSNPNAAAKNSMTSSQDSILSQYEKHYEHPHEPILSGSGYRTYVVSEPDHTSRHYQVPAGAYPTSAPYTNFAATPAPNTEGVQYSSTSAELLAHGFTTRAAPQHRGGVGESSAIRHASAPGEMGARGGSYGGKNMMDKSGTTEGTGNLGERNPQPDGNVAESFSKAGLDGAWKLRK